MGQLSGRRPMDRIESRWVVNITRGVQNLGFGRTLLQTERATNKTKMKENGCRSFGVSSPVCSVNYLVKANSKIIDSLFKIFLYDQRGFDKDAGKYFIIFNLRVLYLTLYEGEMALYEGRRH